jgi:hypothetical protein
MTQEGSKEIFLAYSKGKHAMMSLKTLFQY